MFGLSHREWRFAVVISSTHFTQHFLIRLIPPLIPVLAVALEYPLWQLGLLVSIFSLGSGLGQAPWGVLSDRHDRLYILPTGVGIAGASYVLFAAAPAIGAPLPEVLAFGYHFAGGFVVMCLAMLLVGISSAVVHPTGYPMITANVSPDNKGKVLGTFGSSSKFGDATAPAIVGVLILVFLWDQVLVFLGLAGVAFAAVLFMVLYRGPFETVPGGAESAAGIDTAADGVDANRRAYLYPMLVMYVFFVTKMFAGKGLNTFIPVFLVGVYAYSFDVAGVSFAAESVANFYFTALLVVAGATQLVLGGVTDRFDTRIVLLACVGVATVCILGLALLDLTPLLLLLVLAVLGAGLWGLNPARDALISDITPPEREGRTFGYLWTAVNLTGAVVPVLVGYLLESVGFREGFVVLAAGTVLAAVAIILLFSDRVYLNDPATTGRAAD